MAILGESFDDYVKKQIETRQNKLALGASSYDNDFLKYTHSRTSFLRLTSGVNVTYNTIIQSLDLSGAGVTLNVGSGLADYMVISNANFGGFGLTKGLGDTNPSYGFLTNTNYGYSPPPGILSADVRSLNRGSLREATVNLICHNLNQFQVIDTLFLKLRYSFLLEWGHTTYFDNKGELVTPASVKNLSKDFLGWKKDQYELLDTIEKTRSDSNGNYDAFFGVIKNFSWELLPNGSYNITIVGISQGDVIESLKLNSNVTPDTTTEGTDTNSKYKTSTLTRILGEIKTQSAPINMIDGYQNGKSYWLASEKIADSLSLKTNFLKPDDNQNATSANSSLATGEAGYLLFYDLYPNSPDGNEYWPYYIKLGALLRIIEAFLLTYDKEKSNAPSFKINYAFDDSDNRCLTIPNHIAIDPRICVIPLKFDAKKAAEAATAEYTQKVTTFVFKYDEKTNKYLKTREETSYNPIDEKGIKDLKHKTPEEIGEFQLPTFSGIPAPGTTAFLLNTESDIKIDYGKVITLTIQNEPINYANGPDNNFPLETKVLISGEGPDTLTNKIQDKNIWYVPPYAAYPSGDFTLKQIGVSSITDYNPDTILTNVPGTIKYVLNSNGDFSNWNIYKGVTNSDWSYYIVPNSNPPSKLSDNPTFKAKSVIRKEIRVRYATYSRSNNASYVAALLGQKGILKYLDEGFITAGNNLVGNTMHMYINIDHAVDLLNNNIDESGNISVYNFLTQLMKDVQRSLGNINDFEVICNDTNNTYTIIDNALIPHISKPKNTIAKFNVNVLQNSSNNGGSFVTNFNLKTELFARVANAIAIGSQENGTTLQSNSSTFSYINEGIQDRILTTKLNANQSDANSTFEKTYEKAYNKFADFVLKYLGYNPNTNNGNFSTLTPEDIQEANSSLVDLFNYDLGIYSKNEFTGTGFIPLNLQLTMDGLSGIKIYQVFNINEELLPLMYKNKIRFIIKGVNHRISDKGWETNIETLSIPRKDDASGNPQPGTINVQTLNVQTLSGGSSSVHSRGSNPTPEADRLRIEIKALGYTEKKRELANYGYDLTKDTVDKAISFIKELSIKYPTYKIQFTGGNDEYHQTQSPSSLHTQGKALDIVITSPDPSQLVRKNIIEIAKKYFPTVDDEYVKKSKKATGPHIHMSL